MKILVTGAAGFIGSNFIHYLAKVRPSWSVTIVDALTYAGNLESLGTLPQRSGYAFIKGDIADVKFVEATISKGYNYVVNFAAESHVDRSIHSAEPFVRANILGTQNLLDASRTATVDRYLQISTDEVYGSLGPTGSFLETTPLDPTSPYAASKAAADLMVLAAYKTHKLPALITRCTNNYGPYQFPEKFIPLFIVNALEDKPLPLYGDGSNVRSWLHVEDHCQGILSVLEKGRLGEVYNLGGSSEAEIPNIEVARTILRALKKPESLLTFVTDRLAHDRRYSVDFTKAKSELGWQPTIPFEAGLQQTIGWYLSNKEWWQRVRSGEYRKFYTANYGNRLSSVAV